MIKPACDCFSISLRLMNPKPEKSVYEKALQQVVEAAEADCGALRMIFPPGSSKAVLLATYGYGDLNPPYEVNFQELLRKIGLKPPEEVLGLYLSSLCKTTQALLEALQELRARGKVTGKKVIFFRSDGEEMIFSLSGRRLQGGQRFLVSLRDITQGEQLRQQVFLASKLTSLGEMAAGIAREINNPLQAVVGFSSYWLGILSPTEFPELHRDLEKIRDAGERAARIVRELLRFARGLSEKTQEPCDLRDLVQETLTLFRTQTKATGIELQVYMTDRPVIAKVVRGQIQQVLLNLLQNAQQALEEAPPPDPRIEVRVERRGDSCEITVADNGPGIPEKIQNRIFDPFFTTKPPGKGTGLGLSVSYRIIEEHGGTIRVESQPGKGARFVLSLPLYTGKEAAPSPQPQRQALQDESSVPHMREKTVVVIDDENFVLEYLKRAMEKLGISVMTFSDSEEGYRYLKEGDYDLAFLDLKMSISGKELYERRQREAPDRTQRIVFLTGEIVDEDFFCFVQEAGRLILTKPFSLGRLYAFLGEHLGR